MQKVYVVVWVASGVVYELGVYADPVEAGRRVGTIRRDECRSEDDVFVQTLTVKPASLMVPPLEELEVMRLREEAQA